MMELPSEIASWVAECAGLAWPTGSRFICEPAPKDTDEDYLVFLSDESKRQEFIDGLTDLGFEWDHGEEYDGPDGPGDSAFSSYSKGELNLIITSDETFATRHRAATHVCKSLNLLKKDERVMVFQAVLYANQHSVAEIDLSIGEADL